MRRQVLCHINQSSKSSCKLSGLYSTAAITTISQRAPFGSYAILPCEAEDGTKIMSINLLLENESDPVIWRGPVIAGVVTQFWTDVIWGEQLY